MPKMISYLSRKYEGKKTHDEIVAIAASECKISRKDYYSLDTGTRAALHLSRYKEKYPTSTLKSNLLKAYQKVIIKNDLVDFVVNNGQEGTMDEVLHQIKEDLIRIKKNGKVIIVKRPKKKKKKKKKKEDLTEDAVRGPGRPKTRGLKAGTPSAQVSGAKRTKVGQSLKKAKIPLKASGMPSVTRQFTIVNSETGETIKGEVTEGLPGNVSQMQPVSSSNVKAAGQSGNELIVAFQGNNEGKFYRYAFRTPEMASEARKALIESSSPGRWVWHNLRGHVKGETVSPTKVGPSLERGVPTIGGTKTSLVNYTISKTAPSRVPGYKKMTEVLKRENPNPSEDPSTGARIEGLLGARKGFRELGRKIRQDMTCDFTMTGLLTRSGAFDYRAEGGGIKVKTPENLKYIAENTVHVPVFGRRDRGSHQESDYSLIGFAHNFKYVPPGTVDEYAHIAGEVETFYNIRDLSDLEDPSNLPVSFGFDDLGYGGVQKISKLHHLAVSLNRVEQDRCSTMGGTSCTISPKIKDFTMRKVEIIKR